MPADRSSILALGGKGRRFSYSRTDTILYALGCGLGQASCDAAELQYVYERDLIALPTMACVLTWGFDTLAGAGLDFSKVVHAEQRLEMHAALPAEGEIVADWSVDEVIDKGPGKGALILLRTDLYSDSGDPIATASRAVLARGDGGIGGPQSGGFPPHDVPDRAPDTTRSIVVPTNLALLYRLNGDTNPLHADPDAARAAGFPAPILHGLCTYGIAGRALVEAFCDFDARRLRSLDARFSAPVFPGDTLTFRFWGAKGRQEVGFDAVVEARNATVLRGGRMTYL
jgi:acyl dehydratase